MLSSAAYPDILEKAWLAIAQEATGRSVPKDAVSGLEREARAISDGFTSHRDATFSGYVNSTRALAAYGMYFFPRAYMRTQRVLEECRGAINNTDAQPMRVLDLGAGTGAAGLAAASTLSGWMKNVTVNLTQIDQSDKSLKTAQEIFKAGRELWPKTKLLTKTADARSYAPEEEYDLIISSFAINEWMESDEDEADLEEWVVKLLRNLKPGGLLILLEPSQHFSVERMIRLRDRLAAQSKGNIIAPCPHHEACPMNEEKRGWCHEVRKWRTPETMNWLNRHLNRDIHVLKFSFLVIQRGKQTPKSWLRIVSPVRKEKGKFVFHGCGGDGKLHTCEWLNRKLSKDDLAISENLERGDRVLWENAKRLGDGKTERRDGPPDMVQD